MQDSCTHQASLTGPIAESLQSTLIVLECCLDALLTTIPCMA